MMGKKNLVNFSLSSLRNCKLEQYASEVRKRYFGEVSQTRILEQIPRLECCNLSSRGVLLISGTDAYSFLQGLVTNNVYKLNSVENKDSFPLPSVNSPTTTTGPLYTAFLNAQGRFMFDSFLYKPAKQSEDFLNKSGSGPQENSKDFNETSIFLEVDRDTSEEFTKSLKKFRLRAKVNIEDYTKEFSVWASFPSNIQDPESTKKFSVGYGGTDDPVGQWSAQASSEGGWHWYEDPRLKFLGFRGIFPRESIPPLVASDQIVREESYKKWRYSLGVPEGPTEISSGEALPLEYNLDWLSAIDYNKGCYVGQELTARTHFRGVIRKRVMPVQFLAKSEGNQQFPSVGTEIFESISQKKVGKVVASVPGVGLAHLRLEAIENELENEEHNFKIVPMKPHWWDHLEVQENS